MSRGDDVEVIGRAIVLVVLSTSQEFLVVHDPEFCSLDGVVGIKGSRDPMLAVVVSSPSYLDFISYAVTLASFYAIGMDQTRLSSYVVSWVGSGIPLNIGSVGCIVNDVTSGVDRSVCWSICCSIGWSICCSIGWSICWAAGLTSCSTTSLVRMLGSASGVRTCLRSAVSRTSLFDLSGCNANVGLEVPDHWGIFEVI
jgi:hypothetical protein